jgi:NitT/TauT family transport system substrate-binding protein
MLLFHRLGRKVQLTEAGEFLLSEGGRLIEIETQLRQGINAIKQGQTGKLTVGSTLAVANDWLPNQLWQFAQMYPSIQVQLQTFEQVGELYRALAEERIDLGLCETIPSTEQAPYVIQQDITSFRYGMVVGANHPLATRTWVGLGELQTYPLVLLPPGTPSRLTLEARLLELGLSLDQFSQVQTVDTLALLRTYVTQGEGLGFVADLELVTEREAGQLHHLNILEFAFPYSLHLLRPQRLTSVTEQRRLRGNSSPVQKFAQFMMPSAKLPESQPNPRPPMPIIHPRVTRVNVTPEVITIRLGVQNATIPCVTAGLVMQRLGLLEQFLPRHGRYRNVRYELQWRNYPSGGPIVADLEQGQLDFGVLGDYPLLLSALANEDPARPSNHLIGFAAAKPNGSCSAIVVPQQSQLRELGDLRGHTLALPLGSSAHGMVMRSLWAANLLQDVELVFLHPDTLTLHPPDIAATPADSYAHFAPFPELACRRGQYRYLLDADYQHTPAFYGVVVATDFTQQHPEIIVAYLQALQAAQSWYANTPGVTELIGKWLGFEPELVAQILAPDQFESGQQQFFPTLAIRPDWLAQHIEQLARVKGSEAIGTIDLATWVRPEFLEQLAG